MRARFVMNGQHPNAQVPELSNEFLRFHNHQMHIRRFGGYFRHLFYHRKAEGQVGNKYAIHHIHVQPIGFAPVDEFDDGSQVQEIDR